jgi:POT family proton-dependent oligopeptide transporter
MDAAREQYSSDVVDGAKAVLGVTPFFLALPMFWALFDQNGSAFTLQAKNMNLYGLQPDNTLILNPALVLVLIPLYSKVIFPAMARCGFQLTALRKIGGGMALTGVSFVIAALVQTAMDAAAAKDGDKISIVLIVPQYVVITMSEILVSTIGQEWMFTQAPGNMKSTMMSLWFVSVGIGDLLSGVLYTALKDLPQKNFYWLFAFMMAIAACLFVLIAAAYEGSPFGNSGASSGEGGDTPESLEDGSGVAPKEYQGAVLSGAALSAFSAENDGELDAAEDVDPIDSHSPLRAGPRQDHRV